MRTYSEIHADIEDFWSRHYDERTKLNKEALEYVYDKLQKNFEKYKFDHININIEIEHDNDDWQYIDISANGYPFQNTNEETEELDYLVEIEKLIKNVVSDRLNSVLFEVIVEKNDTLESFMYKYGY